MKAPAKADNLIEAVQTGKLVDVDTTLILEPSWSTRPSCQLGAKHFCTHLHKLSRTISGEVCGDSAKATEHTKGSRYYGNNVCSSRVMHPISLVNDADFDDNTDVDGETHT